MAERYRCDECGHEVPRIGIPADDVGSVRHNCDRMAGDPVRDVLFGRGRKGRMVLIDDSKDQPLEASDG